MTVKTIEERVAEVVSEETSHDSLEKYLEAIRTNMHVVESKYGTYLLATFLLWIGFELIARAAISELSVGPFKVNELSLVQKLFPIAIAYTSYQMFAILSMRSLLEEVHDQLVSKMHTVLYKLDFEYYLLPSSAIVAEDLLYSIDKGFLSKLIVAIALPVRLVIIFGAIVFEIYAFAINFSRFGLNDAVVWVAMLIAILFLVQGLAIYFQSSKLL